MAPRVLVVDDSPTIRKVVSAVLHRHGYDPIVAVDGQAALEILTESTNGATVDLVLVDFVMPRMNGFQLCRALRRDTRLRATPIVLMSAKSDRIREHFVQQTGAIDAITKPFDAHALVAVVENAIRRSEQWAGRAETAVDPSFPSDPEQLDTRAPTDSAVQSTAVHVALSGDLSVIPVGAVLQLLQVESLGGVLVATDGATEVSISIRGGLIDLVQASGAGNEFRLGRYFIERGLVTPDDIDRLLRPTLSPSSPSIQIDPSRTSSDAPRRLLGDLLIDAGRVTREELSLALTRQSSELVYDLLRWPKGHFEFRRIPLPALADSARLGLPVASVVMEGFRRVDEWRVVEAGLGSFDAVLQKDPGADQTATLDRLAPPERRLLDTVDGERTVREIVEYSHMSSFDACKILFQLLEARLVRRRAP
ncbi:MAG: response regulator [Polyangiaceae bacterium]|jgi:DNA-binding response OmpR family regulator